MKTSHCFFSRKEVASEILSGNNAAPNNESARAVLETLPLEIQDHIADHVSTMHSLYSGVKRKEVELSKFQIDGNDTDLNPPSCLRNMKDPLSGSKAVHGNETWDRLMADMEAHLNTFRFKATETMKYAAEFEIEMKTDKLMRAMHYCAYDLSNIHTIMRMYAEN